MNKEMTAGTGQIGPHARQRAAGAGTGGSARKKPGQWPLWLLLASGWYLLWIFVIVQGFIPLQITG